MNRLLAGAFAGLTATLPMTIVMEAVHRFLPEPERYPLYPALVTERVAEMAGAAAVLDRERLPPIALAAHFGYGTASGAVYGLLAPLLPLPAGLRGAAFGLGLFAAGYLGWLPALNIVPPATEYPADRRRLLIGAHIVWGLAADAVLACLSGQGRRSAIKLAGPVDTR